MLVTFAHTGIVEIEGDCMMNTLPDGKDLMDTIVVSPFHKVVLAQRAAIGHNLINYLDRYS